MEGVGLAIPVTCALAAELQRTSAGMTATISGNLMVDLLLEQRTPQTAMVRMSATVCSRFGDGYLDRLLQ
jgi:hypothetical protein